MGEKLYLRYPRRSFKCKRCIEEELSQEIRNKKVREIFVDYYNSPIELSSIQKVAYELFPTFNEAKKLIQDTKKRILNESKKLSQSEREITERILTESEKTEKELYGKIEKYLQAEGNNRVSENSKSKELQAGIHTLELRVTGLNYQNVEVIELQNEYDPEKMLYKVRAKVKWQCISCGVPIHEIADVVSIPVKILKETWEKCPKCGSEMNLQNEKISQKSSKEEKMTDIIEVSGEMICSECKSKLPFSKKMQIRFRSIWHSIKKIKEIELSERGIRIVKEGG